jgi:hypothetical protein
MVTIERNLSRFLNIQDKALIHKNDNDMSIVKIAVL